MSLYKVDVPPLVNGGAAGSAGSSPDEGMGNLTTWSGNVTVILYPVPTVEELVILNRLQPEVQRRNNWLERRIVALQAENEKLREEIAALRADAERYRWHRANIAKHMGHSLEVIDAATDAEMKEAALRREEDQT